MLKKLIEKSGELLEAFDKFQAILLPISVRTSGPIARKRRNLANWY